MCGIAGVFHLDNSPVSPVSLEKMNDAIAHRGPDGRGIWSDFSIGFAHRRLSIIDLTNAAKQPMQTEDGRFVITYNGEIYNYREIRSELESKGVLFHSRSDTEVLLKAFAYWGHDCLLKLNGMFAMGIWDNAEKRLTLARDRFGVKPLYYAIKNGVLFFGSEIKAILAHPRFASELDLEGALEYFTFQNFLSDKTLFKDVRLLGAGSSLEISQNSTTPKIQKYWDYLFQEPEKERPEKEYLEELRFLFEQAVNRQLVSDVPIGSYLSGGMDSGSITAVAATQLDHMRTFTCGFDLSSASGIELNFDERAASEHMSAAFGTEHYEVILKAGDMQRIFPKLAYHLEEPRVGQSYPNYYVAGLASKFNKVVLSGTGGDELFGGYPWRYYRAVVNDNFSDYVDKYYAFWQRLLPNTVLKSAFSPVWGEVDKVWTRDIFESVFKTHANELKRPEDYVNHSLYFEATTFLQGLFVVEDKLSMAHGMETRVPFMDNDLVDFATRLPVKHKLGNLAEVVKLNENDPGGKNARYFQKTSDGKLLLRKMMAGLIPREVVEREKQGFSAPDASWFKGESIDYVQNLLGNPGARCYEVLDYDTMQGLIGLHMSGKENKRLLIWSMLNFEHTLREFF